MIHLTNEAVQKRGEDFGKFENGNKLSYAEFQKYIDTTYPKENYNFMQTVYPAMKVMIAIMNMEYSRLVDCV